MRMKPITSVNVSDYETEYISLYNLVAVCDNHNIGAGDVTLFACYATGLPSSTTYYVRAYAATSEGTVYGQSRQFTTLVDADGDTPPVGGDDEQNPSASDYRPDALDGVSANVCTIGMIYAFYGRLSVASTDVDKFRASKIPSTFFAYGTRDPFYRQFQQCADAVRAAGVEVEQHEYESLPHGFGYTHEEWMISFDHWMTKIMANN